MQITTLIETWQQQLTALDKNAAALLPRLLKKVGVVVLSGEIVRDKRGSILIGIGLPDLMFRLQCQSEREKGRPQDEIARAKIWHHVCEASLPGESIADISGDNRYQLNPWIVTPALKFRNERLSALSALRQREPEPTALKKPPRRSLEHRQTQMLARNGAETIRPPHFQSASY